MLRHFRINDPYRLLSLLVMLILASLPFLISLPPATLQEIHGFVVGESIGNKLMYVEIIDKTPPLMALTDGVLNFFFGRSLMAGHIIALLIIFFQASYFGILLINNKAYNESNYLPSLVCGFLCFYSFDLLAITPELLASGFLLLALNSIFKEIEFRVERDSIVLNLGVFLGLASLYVFSYTVFLFGSVLILILFARASARKVLLLFFGYAIVHGILLIYYYSLGRADELWANFYIPSLSFSGSVSVSVQAIFLLGIIPLIYFIFSMFMLTREAHFTRYQSQLFQVMFLWLVYGLIQVFITPALTPHSFITFIPPLSYFISHYLLLINRKWIAETMLWLLMIGLLTVNFLSKEGVIKKISYAGIFIQDKTIPETGKRIMMLGDDVSVYSENKLGGYFLDWTLSRKYFEHPDYYSNLSKINRSFMDDPPEIIYDKSGLMEKICDRIPSVKNSYRKEGEIYYRR